MLMMMVENVEDQSKFMNNDTGYWNKYYKNHFIDEASPFARFCHETYLERPMRMVEFGSGSGRDLRFFHHAGHEVTGYDTSEEAVSHIRKSYPDLDMVLGDFSELDAIEGLDIVYSRWTLHSVDEEAGERALKWCARNLPESGLLLIEVRTVNDGLFGEGRSVGRNAFVTDHYRRFIIPEELKQSLVEMGFDLEYFVEGQGFSVYKGDDPVLLRVVAKRSARPVEM